MFYGVCKMFCDDHIIPQLKENGLVPPMKQIELPGAEILILMHENKNKFVSYKIQLRAIDNEAAIIKLVVSTLYNIGFPHKETGSAKYLVTTNKDHVDVIIDEIEENKYDLVNMIIKNDQLAYELMEKESGRDNTMDCSVM